MRRGRDGGRGASYGLRELRVVGFNVLKESWRMEHKNYPNLLRTYNSDTWVGAEADPTYIS